MESAVIPGIEDSRSCGVRLIIVDPVGRTGSQLDGGFAGPHTTQQECFKVRFAAQQNCGCTHRIRSVAASAPTMSVQICWASPQRKRRPPPGFASLDEAHLYHYSWPWRSHRSAKPHHGEGRLSPTLLRHELLGGCVASRSFLAAFLQAIYSERAVPYGPLFSLPKNLRLRYFIPVTSPVRDVTQSSCPKRP